MCQDCEEIQFALTGMVVLETNFTLLFIIIIHHTLGMIMFFLFPFSHLICTAGNRRWGLYERECCSMLDC